jgi:multicomponent Na+:H+ antiporter subunit B
VIVTGLLAFMGATAIAVARLRNLFAVVMLTGVFSLTAAVLYVALDAVDVAFTEASVGAGIATVLMLATVALTGREEKVAGRAAWPALVVVAATGALLVYGTLDMPAYGDPTAPIHRHVVPRYLERTPSEVGVPNVVTSVLASYRGYDTLGETYVIFTAAVGVLVILGRLPGGKAKERKRPPEEAPQ